MIGIRKQQGGVGMKYILDFKPDVLHIHMEGEFTFMDARCFRRILSAIKSDHDRKEVRLNMRHISLLDATALSLVMFAHDLAKKLHVDLIFEEPQGQVSGALQEAALYNCLAIRA